ncbi:NLPA lipoprotein [Ligilactobacillus agilis DSM 20509]|uniref:NLPA lipoprotein n=1 Tax=Ligilactobacillus agilis DSM 20509 TaxID=1423718 RepID=A0A0R2A7G2_9LACO|nr:MetQ/NlpA family ABC transporter substrate-binding protein [Ligilactobacillus agilis]KRM63272.1 NLPA lipoprotein [Ligilactobacillus agilis DSM 20509]MBM6762650.1 metal ABC transporter substrate-binding protein [Ligilactobacillus agilis]
MKKSYQIILGVIVVIVALVLGIHALNSSKKSAESATITVGSMNTDYQVWKHIAESKEAKKLGLKIKVKSITDGVQLNNATAQGSVDVNAFQSWSYLETYNKQHKKTKLAALGTTYYEPMGLYSNKYKKVAEIPDGATIAIANNPSQAARGLLLLQKAGLITLKKNFDSATGTTSDINANPKNLKFKEIDDTTGPRVLKSVDAVIISNSVAFDGGLNVLKDSIYHETISKNTKDNINVLATAAKNKDNKAYQKLVKLFHSKAIQAYVNKKFSGTKVEVKKPVSYLED